MGAVHPQEGDDMGGECVFERQSAEEAIVNGCLCLNANGCGVAAGGYVRGRRAERKLLIPSRGINRNTITLEALEKIAPIAVPDSGTARTSTETRMQQLFFSDRTYVGAAVHTTTEKDVHGCGESRLSPMRVIP
jgi:hypothetical protein